MTVEAAARWRTSDARRWMERLRHAWGKGVPLREQRDAPNLARAEEASSYVRKLVAERGWTRDIEREAGRIAAAALASEGLPASRARAGGMR